MIARGGWLHALADQDGTRARRIDCDVESEHTPIVQGDFRLRCVACRQCSRCLRVCCNHRELVASLTGRQLPGHERDVLHYESCDLIQPAAAQNALRLPGIDGETAQARCLREGAQRHLLGRTAAVLRNQECDRARLRALQRQLYFDLVGLHGLPVGFQLLAIRILKHDALDATDTARLQMNGIFPTHDQRPILGIRQLPFLSVRVHQFESGPGIFLESPVAVQRALDPVAQARGAQRGRIDDKPALLGIRPGRQLEGLAVLAGHAQRHLVRVTGREDQRRALHREHQDVLSCAVDFLRIDSVQRRQLRLLHRRQCDDQHRLRVAKRRRRVECQGKLFTPLRGERRDVLIVSRVE